MVSVDDYYCEFFPTFKGIADETEAYLRILEMLFKASEENDEMTSRISAASEEDTAFEDAPAQGSYDVKIEVSKAYRYLSEMVSESEECGYPAEDEISLSRIISVFGFEGYSLIGFLLACAPVFDPDYAARIKKFRTDKSSHSLPTFNLIEKLSRFIPEYTDIYTLQEERKKLEDCPLINVTSYSDNSSDSFDSFKASDYLQALLRGDNSVPSSQRSFCTVGTKAASKPLSGADTLSCVSNLLKNRKSVRVINVYGKKGSGRKYLISKAVKGGKVIFLKTDTFLLLPVNDAKKELYQIIARALLTDSELVFSDCSVSEKDRKLVTSLFTLTLEYLQRIIVTSFKDSDIRCCCDGYSYHSIEVRMPHRAERADLWARAGSAFGKIDPEILKEASVLYDLTPGMIEEAVKSAFSFAAGDGRSRIVLEDIKRAVISFNSTKLMTLATPLKGKHTLEDLRIAESQRKLIKLACSRLKNRGIVEEDWGYDSGQTYGKGISIIMYGPPGTGKTMAATVIANEVGRELYRVDLSQMMDKYVGETEKNLGKVFDAARDGNFILFFDEADSLFAKRTEVANSNDKHANNEVSYLLQKMEEYDGMSIMATNKFGNFDSAFLRRITYIVNLDKPDAKTRLLLFKSSIPKTAPVDPKLDLEFFSNEFELSGSLIRSTVTSAAYMACDEGVPLSNRHLVNAVYMEERKDGRMHSAEDFGKYGIMLTINT